MALDDINIDYGNGPSGTGSYFTRGLTGGVPFETDINKRMSQSLMNAGSGDVMLPEDIGTESSLATDGSGLVQPSQYGIDFSTQQYINRNVANALRNNAPMEALSAREYYPLGNEPVEVGQFSGPLGSVSLFSAGAAEIPYEMLYAKQRARDAQEAIDAAKRNRQITWDLAKTKDALHNEIFVNQQNEDWIPWVNEKITDLKLNPNVRPEDYADIITGSQEYKEKVLKWNNVADSYDQVFDWATQAIMFKNEQAIPGVTTIKKTTSKEKGGTTTGSGKTKASTGEEQYDQTSETSRTGEVSAEDVPYVSDHVYGIAQRFMNETRKSKVDIDALADIMNEMQYAKSMDKIINETADSWNANIQSSLIKAKIDGRWVTTDKENAYLLMEQQGIINSRSPELKSKIREVYDSQYKYIDPKFRPEFETEFYPQQVNALTYQEKATFQKLDKFDWFRIKQLEFEKTKAQLGPIQPTNGKEQIQTAFGTAQVEYKNKIVVPWGTKGMTGTSAITAEYNPVSGKWIERKPGPVDYIYMGSMDLTIGGNAVPVGVVRIYNSRTQEYEKPSLVPYSDVAQFGTTFTSGREVLQPMDQTYTPGKVTKSDFNDYGSEASPINNPGSQPVQVLYNADGSRATFRNEGGGVVNTDESGGVVNTDESGSTGGAY